MPPELEAAVAESLLAPVAGARTALQAELVVSHMVGTVRDGVEGGPEDVEEAVRLLLSGLVAPLEAVGSADALAALRVLQVYAPDGTRQSAAAAADRLVGTAVKDRPWAGRVGCPQFLRAFRYGDLFGQQTSLGVLFTDRGRDHALMVLIDHQLGGGLKDVWVAEGRDATGMRQRVIDGLSQEPGVEVADVGLAAAAEILRDAVDRLPCPVDPDQVDDVVSHFELARVRARHLCDLAGIPGPATAEVLAADRAQAVAGAEADGSERPGGASVLRLKVTLRGIKPLIWRRLEVPSDMPLSRLHRVLQVAFDWDDAHLHRFETIPQPAAGARSRRAGPVGRAFEGPALRRTRLADLIGSVGDRLLYRYDFGDDWEHDIQVEAVHAAVPGADYPRCTAGRRAAPPEDCGGWPGYDRLLDALADPEDPDHDDLRHWVPEGWSPDVFDRDAVNTALRRLR